MLLEVVASEVASDNAVDVGEVHRLGLEMVVGAGPRSLEAEDEVAQEAALGEVEEVDFVEDVEALVFKSP